MTEGPGLIARDEPWHTRMLRGDPTAPAGIAEAYFSQVISKLRHVYANIYDPDLVDTAVETAFISYFERPDQYDPAKLPLPSYLRMSADRDLRNLLRGSGQNRELVDIDQVVELEDSSAEYQVKDEFDLEEAVIASDSPVWEKLERLLPDPLDRELVLLMMEGVRSTEIFAELLQVANRPTEDQAAIVKRNKDRVKKVLARAIDPRELRE